MVCHIADEVDPPLDQCVVLLRLDSPAEKDVEALGRSCKTRQEHQLLILTPRLVLPPLVEERLVAHCPCFVVLTQLTAVEEV